MEHTPLKRRSGARPVRSTISSTGKAAIIIMSTFIALVLIGVSAYTYYLLNFDTFYPGVTIDGMDLRAMTPAEAAAALRLRHQPQLDEVAITFTFEDKVWNFGYDDIDTRVNIEEVVNEAYKVGRTGNFLQRIIEILKVESEGRAFQTELTYNTAALVEDIRQIAREIYIEPQDATITFNNKQEELFTFTGEQNGRSVSIDKVLEDIKEKIKNGDFSPYSIEAETLYPEITLEEVKTWTTKLVSFHTVMTGTAERIHNITLSSSSFDGIRIDPGQIFSLNEATGPRGLEDGYKNAPVIVRGVRLADEPGGGNCQTSTTLYGAVVRADLEIIERWHHSWPSSYTEVGQDAMVDYPTADLKIRNNYDTPVFIGRTIDGDKLIVEIYGKQRDHYDNIEIVTEVLSKTDKPAEEIVDEPNLYVGDSVVEYASRAGIKCQSYRVYYKDGEEIKRVKEAYSNYPRIVGRKRVGTKPIGGTEPTDQTPADNNGNNTENSGNAGEPDSGNSGSTGSDTSGSNNEGTGGVDAGGSSQDGSNEGNTGENSNGSTGGSDNGNPGGNNNGNTGGSDSENPGENNNGNTGGSDSGNTGGNTDANAGEDPGGGSNDDNGGGAGIIAG